MDVIDTLVKIREHIDALLAKRRTQKHRSAQCHEERDPATGRFVRCQEGSDDIESESGDYEGETFTVSENLEMLERAFLHHLAKNILGREMIVTAYFCSVCDTYFNTDEILHCPNLFTNSQTCRLDLSNGSFTITSLSRSLFRLKPSSK